MWKKALMAYLSLIQRIGSGLAGIQIVYLLNARQLLHQRVWYPVPRLGMFVDLFQLYHVHLLNSAYFQALISLFLKMVIMIINC
jgi:hypothetical protein